MSDDAARRPDERGETLVEVLVAILIIGLTSVSLLGAFLVSIAGSSEHRTFATVDTLLRSFAGAAEYQVQLQPAPLFVQCAGPLTYQIVEPYPANAAAGSTIQVFGSGYKAGNPVTIKVGVVSVTANIVSGSTVSPSGAVAATVKLPSSGLVFGANALTISDGANSGTGSINISSSSVVTSSVTNYSLRVSSVQYWNGSSFTSTCTHGGNAPQLLTIAATTPGAVSDSVTVVVSNPSTIGVPVPPVFTTANSATFSEGTFKGFTVSASGNPVPNFSESGALPTGVTFTDNDGFATLAGTPQPGTGGSYVVTFTATNGIVPDATQTFTLLVGGPPTITSAPSDTEKTSTAFTFTVTTSGIPTASLGEAGALPSGVSFLDKGNGTATISGTPAAGTGGVYHLTLTASNGNLPNATQSFSLIVDQPPAITSPSSALFPVGASSNFTVTTTGYPTVSSITRSGALPNGVTLTDNGNGTATIAGTPAAGTGGVYPITLTAGNGVAPNATQSFTLTVGTAPIFTSASSAAGHAKVAFSFNVTTSGTPAATITHVISGGAAAWLVFGPSVNGAVALSGTPPKNSSGSVTITFTATNGVAPAATQVFTLTWS